MKIKDVNIVLGILNDRADDLKERVECRMKYSSHLDYLANLVRNCSFSPEDKFSLCNLILEKESTLNDVVLKYNEEISSIDCFVSEISQIIQSLNDNDETCIYCDLESD